MVIAIDVEESRETVEKLVRGHGLSYANLLDEDGSVGAQYGVRSTPMKFIIDTKGNVIGAALGYREWDDEEMKSVIRKLID